MKLKNTDKRYFQLLTRMLQYSKSCASELNLLLTSLENVYEIVERIDRLESEADHLLHSLSKSITSSALKTRQKDKMILLANKLDDVTDSIERVAYAVDMYSLNIKDEDAIELSKLILKATEGLIYISGEFPFRSDYLNESVVLVNRLEEEGDRIYHSAIKRLFSSKSEDVQTLIKLKEIYESLECVMNACEVAADTFDSLALEIK